LSNIRFFVVINLVALIQGTNLENKAA